MTNCPTCGRRPSERDAATGRGATCEDPIHDAADRYAHVGEEMEKLLRGIEFGRGLGSIPICPACLFSEPEHDDACELVVVLTKLPPREEVADG